MLTGWGILRWPSTRVPKLAAMLAAFVALYRFVIAADEDDRRVITNPMLHDLILSFSPEPRYAPASDIGRRYALK